MDKTFFWVNLHGKKCIWTTTEPTNEIAVSNCPSKKTKTKVQPQKESWKALNITGFPAVLLHTEVNLAFSDNAADYLECNKFSLQTEEIIYKLYIWKGTGLSKECIFLFYVFCVYLEL